MKKYSMIIVWAVVCSIALSGMAAAHGTGHSLLTGEETVSLAFYYSDKTPMKYAEVFVFSPGDRDIEHQNGRTDKNGIFVFRPDAAGDWFVKVSDGMGHAAEATVHVGKATLDRTSGSDVVRGSQGTAPSTKTMGIITGLSLILNAVLVFYLVKSRSRRMRSIVE